DFVPIFCGHFVKGLVAEVPSVVDHDVYPAKGVQRCLDNTPRAPFRLNAVVTRHRFPARLSDFVDHSIGSSCSTPTSFEPSTKIIDHHPGTSRSELQSIRPAEPPRAPGDYRNPSVDSYFFQSFLLPRSTQVSHKLQLPQLRSGFPGI